MAEATQAPLTPKPPVVGKPDEELNRLLNEFARYLRYLEPALADGTPPAERALMRKSLRAYVVELERLGNDEPKAP